MREFTRDWAPSRKLAEVAAKAAWAAMSNHHANFDDRENEAILAASAYITKYDANDLVHDMMDKTMKPRHRVNDMMEETREPRHRVNAMTRTAGVGMDDVVVIKLNLDDYGMEKLFGRNVSQNTRVWKTYNRLVEFIENKLNDLIREHKIFPIGLFECIQGIILQSDGIMVDHDELDWRLRDQVFRQLGYLGGDDCTCELPKLTDVKRDFSDDLKSVVASLQRKTPMSLVEGKKFLETSTACGGVAVTECRFSALIQIILSRHIKCLRRWANSMGRPHSAEELLVQLRRIKVWMDALLDMTRTFL